MSSVRVFVDMGLVRQLQVEEPGSSCGPRAPVFPEPCRRVEALAAAVLDSDGLV